MCESVDTEAERAALSIKAKHVALFFGFVRPYKGLRYLIEALPAVLEHIDLHSLVVGEFWEPIQVYRDQIARLGVEHAVTVVDRYVPNEELGRYFGVADVVVLPYESATQSAVLQLAYGFGVPAITTRVGGLSEVVRDGETGLLVSPADSGDLARAMIHFFAENLGATFRDNIRREHARFGWDHLVSTVEKCVAAGT
jgi:glycosyltransferase involved in cell wall biosynthesis